MPGKHFSTKLRQEILRRHGLEEAKFGKLRPKEIPPPDADGRKTLAMRLIEAQWEQGIEELLAEGSLAEVARMLGIEESTVSKWRLRLGLR